jgi:hypothetical protein
VWLAAGTLPGEAGGGVMLQEMADVSDAWCVAEMARLDVVLGQTEKVK